MILSLVSAVALATPPKTYTWRQTLDAIRIVETGGCANQGRGNHYTIEIPHQSPPGVYEFDGGEAPVIDHYRNGAWCDE